MIMFDPKRKGPILGEITAWSHSRLKTFEECPMRSHKQQVLKIRYDDNDTTAADRGSEIHKQMEDFIQCESDEVANVVYPDLHELLQDLRDLWKDGQCIVEEDWGFDIDWDETGYYDDDIWARVKIDVLVWENYEHTVLTVIDWKTGKGSDIAKFKYADQMNNYAIACFMKYPDLEFVETRLKFVDKTERDMVQRYTRDQAMKLLPRLNERALNLTTASFFPPNPSKHNCRFCEYASHEECEWRHSD
jgi:CRISPR/Cas system-associated exonuclease Cas4 (RecB family)